jgi:hypothetical protein
MSDFQTVQITRTVTVEDVPLELLSMIRESEKIMKEHIESSFQALYDDLDSNNLIAFLDDLQNFRVHLGKADIKLNDCHGIALGFVQMLTSTPEDKPAPQNQAASYQNAPDLEGLKKKMEQYVDNIKDMKLHLEEQDE